MISQARIETAKAADYLVRLCKHFAHKIPATYGETTGRVEFEAGICHLEAGPDALLIRVEGADEAAIARLEDVVARHLVRFAWKEELRIDWLREPGAEGVPA